MHSNQYLYNTDEVPEFPREVIVRRIELLREHLDELLEAHYIDRDDAKIEAVLKAIKWHQLIGKD